MRLRRMALATALVVAPRAASAEPPPEEPDIARLVLDPGRPRIEPAEEDLVRFVVHGEYEGRYTHLRPFPLDVSAHTVQEHPGAIEDSLGQTDFVHHWLRLTPRLQYRKTLEIVGQLD